MQVIGIRNKPVKYYCCDCHRKLSARAKTPDWRKIPSDQKRCLRCSARYRSALRHNKDVRISERRKIW